MFLKVIRQLFGHDLVNYGTDFGVSELAFRLSLEFTFGELYGDNGVDSLAYRLARERNELFLLLFAFFSLFGLFVICIRFLISLYKVVHDLA